VADPGKVVAEVTRMTTPTTTAPDRGNHADVLLFDGTVGTVRPVDRSDRAALLELHDGLGDDALRLRFFGISRIVPHRYVDHVLEGVESDAVLALGLWQHGRLLGVATAELDEPGPAEVAFLVADDQHGKGIGTILVEHLAGAARRRGIGTFTADVLVDNTLMLRVMRDAGFQVFRHLDSGVVTVQMSTTQNAESLEAADARETVAEAASLRPLLSPRSVAVVGVRRDGTGVGAAILAAILDGGFTGNVAVVHPTGSVPSPVPTYRTFDDVPGPLDLVVVAVPPEQVPACVESAGVAGAGAAVVVTSGFAELGEPGASLQRELTRVARAQGIRVVGPNCLGLLDNQLEVRLDATFAGAMPPTGGLALASQSGGVGIVVIDLARSVGLGVRHFVSLGNKADVSSNDLLAAWYDDPGVTAAALYLESFGNAAKFARVARRFSERKPLLAVVGGRSQGGQRAGLSHTAAAATPGVRVDALFAQSGVIGCRDADDLAVTALLLSEQPLPVGRRVAVVGNAGGIGVLAADALDEEGLEVPAFSDSLRERLAPHLAGTVGADNPVDAGAAGTPEALGRLVAELADDEEVDVVLVTLVRTRTMDWSRSVREVSEAATAHPDTPVVAVLLGGPDQERGCGLTVLPAVASAVRAIGHAVRYAEWRGQPRTGVPERDRERSSVLRTWAAERMSTVGPGWTEPEAASQLLRPYGVSMTGTLARGADAAVAGAAAPGRPGAHKVADADVVHKTERGLVRVRLASLEEVEGAARAFAVEVGHEDVDLLVQPMLDGVEIAVGIVRDPGPGPLVMVAPGGTATELWQDSHLLLAPVSAADVRRALRSLRTWPLLAGFRGAPPVDVEALVELVVAVGALATEVPEVAELDLNPVLVRADGVALVDVKLRLAPADACDDLPRSLRSP
jgi:acyl-CoA synthetase (NDP forming)/GNAT superfamily N-acetyltransferase